MNKKVIIITTISIIIALILGIIVYKDINKKPSIKKDDESKEVIPTGYKMIDEIFEKDSKYQEMDFKYDKAQEKLTLNNKYDIYIKSGYYLMNVQTKGDEEFYCDFVDLVETYLGANRGEYIQTCKYTLDGKIGYGAIGADIYDSYKVLTVNYNELATKYNNTNNHKEDELISVDEVNYNIVIGNHEFTAMSNGYTKDINLYSICGHVYGKTNKTFTFTTYDKDKNIISEQEYEYTNQNNRFNTFCVNYENDLGLAKYYSVK